MDGFLLLWFLSTRVHNKRDRVSNHTKVLFYYVLLLFIIQTVVYTKDISRPGLIIEHTLLRWTLTKYIGHILKGGQGAKHWKWLIHHKIQIQWSISNSVNLYSEWLRRTYTLANNNYHSSSICMNEWVSEWEWEWEKTSVNTRYRASALIMLNIIRELCITHYPAFVVSEKVYIIQPLHTDHQLWCAVCFKVIPFNGSIFLQ